MALVAAVSKLRFRLRLACMELSTICHLRWRVCRLACEVGGSEAGWGAGLGLFGEEVVGEGGDVGYIDGAVGVDVGDCFAVGF